MWETYVRKLVAEISGEFVESLEGPIDRLCSCELHIRALSIYVQVRRPTLAAREVHIQ